MNQIPIFNIEEDTLINNNFRKVLYTSPNPNGMQLVVMSLNPRQNIGYEIHPHTDQFIRIEQGNAITILGNERYEATDGDAFIVPAGTYHDVINVSSTKSLKLYTVYTPPNHSPYLVQRFKPI